MGSRVSCARTVFRFRSARWRWTWVFSTPALESRKVDLIAGNSTDGLIAALHAVVLEDDRRYFPPYEAAFVVRGRVWRERKSVRRVLESLAGTIDSETMRRLNAAVDKDKRRPEDVAREFLAARKKSSGG